MPLLKPKTARDDVADVEVPRLQDDPTYAAAAALLAAFSAFEVRLERSRTRLQLQRHFDTNTPADGARARQLRDRLTRLDAEEPSVPALPRSADDAPPAVAAGLEVLNGRDLAAPLDHAARLQSIDQKIAVIGAAISAQAEIVDGLAAELTFDYCHRLKPAWDALQVELFRNAQELARTTRRLRDLRGRIAAAGIGVRSDILAMPNCRAPLLLGDESDPNSEITSWRKILEQVGIL